MIALRHEFPKSPVEVSWDRRQIAWALRQARTQAGPQADPLHVMALSTFHMLRKAKTRNVERHDADDLYTLAHMLRELVHTTQSKVIDWWQS